ncbi:MAG TPA: Na/Pi cotransporter family protein [Syntrophales bacterium]|jgi:phosphate:Na+ symporter|nr:Na/Pi cotransporter family protein [Syntrophales bacterium]HON23831.1 Na/Pi cotransporter family protein [Syntrophales bacterium]HOU76859.1 Na/Pi cotransporter family protein [Syntrophales bacterium]HPC31628.1 Na/Pi cotransporter family protein [Syntrophales bacterium]HQG35446.1 Na/Pi cotransporter family protein [Syntrophales bacterium]
MMASFLLLNAGIVLFLFGMLKLSAGIQQLFTSRVRDYIKYAVQRPFFGLLTGVAATVLFQSSSATTVIAVGMVSAGLIAFYNALAIVLGADLGTTVIVQLVVWKITDASPLFIVTGGIVWFTTKEKWKNLGEAVFYFGLLFFGLSLVGTATAPLQQHPEIIGFFRETMPPLLGFTLSALFTALIHASAIPISILAILAQQDLVRLDNALPMVIGANVGTTVTALMAGLVSGVGGRRAAFSHFFFKAAGAAICLPALPLLLELLRGLSPSVAQQIALGHLLFNLIIVAVFFPFLSVVARLLVRLLPGEEKVLPLWPEFLQEEALTDPPAALATVARELERQIVIAAELYRRATPLRTAYREGRRRDVLYVEMVINHLREEIVSYLRKISCSDLSPALSQRLFAYTAMADDIERLANHIVSLVSLSREKHYRSIAFTGFAEQELDMIEGLVGMNIADAVYLIRRGDGDRSTAVARRENEIDAAVKEAREKHLVRFHRRLCQAEAGPVFIEMLIHLERISDHCQNIAEHVAELPAEDP